MIYGDNLWRNPQVFLGAQPASDVEILPDMKGIVATFDKVQQPAGWQPKDEVGVVVAWVWTSEGNTSVGDVVLHKPPKPAEKAKGKLEVEVKTNSPRVTVKSDSSGVVQIDFKFAQITKEGGAKEDKVPHVFMDFTGAVPAVPAPKPTCLEVGNQAWKIMESCRLQVTLQGLAVNTTVSLKAFRTENKEEDGTVVAEEELTWLVSKN